MPGRPRRRRRGRGASAGLAMAVVVAGCAGPPDVPFGVRDSETVWCADADGVVDTVTWQGHDGPLTALDVRVLELHDGPVSEEDLVEACARQWRWSARHTVCEAYTDVDALRRHAASELVADRHGEAGARPPGFPVVVRGGVRCEDLVLRMPDASDPVPAPDRLRPLRAIESFNGWRARETAWRDAADAGCLDLAMARGHALTAQAELDGTWLVLETAHDPEHPSHAGLCFDVRLRRGGFIEVGYHAVESPVGRSGPIDVTDAAEPDAPQQ